LGLAMRQGATRLVVVKSCTIDPTATLAQLGQQGVVDRRFAGLACGTSMPIELASHRQIEALRSRLQAERNASG
ncbi:MAG: aspartate kinase, partial [Burkholderiaceae bacterium]|nr:aspartate kinase [Burkholderiaceae bacterium]